MKYSYLNTIKSFLNSMNDNFWMNEEISFSAHAHLPPD